MFLIKNYNCVIYLLFGYVGEYRERNDNCFYELLKKYFFFINYKIYFWKELEDFLEILSLMNFYIGNCFYLIIFVDILGILNIGIGSYRLKIFNYIYKIDILVKERLVDFMKLIFMERIMIIFC